jgi:hypothetical protein
MKRIIFFLFLFLTLRLVGQDFGTIGTKWYYSESAGGLCPGNCEYLLLSSIKDSSILGITTHKIVQKYYMQNGEIRDYQPIFVYSKNDTVYRYSFSKQKFITLYIFNHKKGDTLTLDSPDDNSKFASYRLVIDSLKIESVDGISLKKYWTKPLDDYQFYDSGSFMDRIGGLDWFYPRAAIIPEAGGPIRCYLDSQIDTSFQNVACDYLVLRPPYKDIYKLDNKVKISPNPSTSRLRIESEIPIDLVELVDISGKIALKSNQQILDISKLPNGQYLMRISFVTGQKLEKKIIKNAH